VTDDNETTESGAEPFDHFAHQWSVVEIGERLFQWRDYTPIPLIVLVLFAAEPTVRTATLGTLLCIAGELIRIYSVAFIGSVSRTRNTTTTGGNLIRTGPFAHVRNPLYVGNFLITAGVAIFSGVTWLAILAVVAFAFQYYCIVKYEEKLLLEKFGHEYEQYMQAVPAWIPARLPPLEAVEWPESFSPALKSERRTLAAVALMLLALALLAGGGHHNQLLQ
jgi:protein-S-isoprenylcysteine O-methyltransferase Ste14